MLRYLLVVMAFQFSGEGIKAACGVTFPGPLIGMILMLTWLFLRGGVPENLNLVSSALVNHLGLFFVPAGAGRLRLPSRDNGRAPMLSKLISGPIFWLPIAIAFYLAVKEVYERSNRSPFSESDALYGPRRRRRFADDRHLA